jgi:hypothetical protein
MQTTTAKKIFPPFARPLTDCHRRAVLLDFAEQDFDTIDLWATEHGVSFAAVLDQAAAQIARQLTATMSASSASAQPLQIDQIDLSSLIDGSIDRLIDGSIRATRGACGKSASFIPPATAFHASPESNPEHERTHAILGYYRALTGNRVRPADYQSVRLVFDFPDLAIQAGILHALNYAARRIGSFAYCVRAIQNFLDPALDLELVCDALIEKLLTKRSTGQLVLPLEGEKLLIGDFKK